MSDSIAKSPSYSEIARTAGPKARIINQSQVLRELQESENLNTADRIRRLSRHLKISPVKAAEILRQAGIAVTAEDLREFYEKRRMIQEQRRIRHQKYLERKEAERRKMEIESDENFSFIAGYTSGGAPYGVPWEDTPPSPGPDIDDDTEFDFSKATDYPGHL